jgi:Imidazoleglycerol-phosphate dehydratase
MREAAVKRKTKETEISLRLCLDGGEIKVDTGIGFFDHMLEAFALHGKLGLTVSCKGDLHVDGHHTVEDVGIVLGDALKQALGDKKGINRFGHSYVPMDEALALTALDLSGRPFHVYQALMPQEMCGDYETCLTQEFMRSLAVAGGVTLHQRAFYGDNAHHITEALYKSFGRALHIAVTIIGTELASTKGVL